jgi:Domain of unknown function (DUF5011)/Bacterial Ig-like domain
MKKIFYTKMPIIIGLVGFFVLVSWATTPTLTVVTPVPTNTSDSTPNFTFSSTETGSISYAWGCNSTTGTTAVVWSNTVTFDTLADGTYGSCTVTVTNNTDSSTPLAVPSFTVDTILPVVTEITPVTTPTNDSTPNYTFSGSEIATINYGWDCSSATTSTVIGNNTITFNTLTDGIHNNCTVRLTDAAGNQSSILSVTAFTTDATVPTVVLTSASGSATNQSPFHVTAQFSETVTWFGSWDILVGSWTISNFIAVDGDTYTFDITPAFQWNITIDIPSASSVDTVSNPNTPASQLIVNYDTIAPTLSQVTPVTTPTNDTTPNYTFSSSEIGTISYSWSCVSSNTWAISWNNTITLNTLTEGVYSTCSLKVTDIAGNQSLFLSLSPFTIDTTAPTVALSSIVPNPTKISPISVTAQFSETVTGFVVWDIVVWNGTAWNFVAVDGDTYTFDITPTADGTVTVNIAGSTSQDIAWNNNTAATQLSRTYDTTPPTVTLTSPAAFVTNTSPIVVTAQFSETATGFTSSDISAWSGTISNFVAVDGDTYTFDLSPTSQWIVTVDIASSVAQDIAWNNNTSATQFSRTYDTTPPVITRTGSGVVTTYFSVPYTDSGATWSDNNDGTGTLTASGTVNVNILWTYILTYHKTDIAGNIATVVSRTVNVVADITAPVITLSGSTTLTLEAGSSYIDVGATWFDNADGTGTVTASGTVNTLLPWIYTLTFDKTDFAWNNAIQRIRTVTIQDTTRPVITLSGSANITFEAGSPYTDSWATWSDTVDGTWTLTASGTVNGMIPWVYTLTYHKTDGAWNIATVVSRTVTVQDTIAPVITLSGSINITLEAGSSYTDSGATWSDAVSGTGTLTASWTVNTLVPWVYTLTYHKTDTAGNIATVLSRTVTVRDTTAPVITLIGNASLSIPTGSTYSDSGATWTDTVDGNGTINWWGAVDTFSPWVYLITYNKTDAAGNVAATVTRTVTVYNASGGGGWGGGGGWALFGSKEKLKPSASSTIKSSTGTTTSDSNKPSTLPVLTPYTYTSSQIQKSQKIIDSMYWALSKKTTSTNVKTLESSFNNLKGALYDYENSKMTNTDKVALKSSLDKVSATVSKIFWTKITLKTTNIGLDSSFEPKKIITPVIQTPVIKIEEPTVTVVPIIEPKEVPKIVALDGNYVVNAHSVKLTLDSNLKTLSAWMKQGDTVQILEDGDIVKVKILTSYLPRYVGKEGYIYKKHLKKAE